MIRVTDDGRSEEDLPFVYWQQAVPTGESAYARQQSMELKIAAVIMVFVFAAVWAWSESFGGAALAAFLVGGMCLAGDRAFRGGIKVWDMHIPGPEPRDTSEADRRAKATPILGKQFRGVEVAPDEDGRELQLCLAHGASAKAMEWVRWVPLASVQSFELGTAEEWFEGISDSELRRTASAANSWVIVAPTVGHGVLWVAESAGSKAEIAALHGLLTQRFIVDGPELLRRWRERLEDAELDARIAANAARDGAGAHEPEDRRRNARSKLNGSGEGGDAAGTDHRRE